MCKLLCDCMSSVLCLCNKKYNCVVICLEFVLSSSLCDISLNSWSLVNICSLLFEKIYRICFFRFLLVCLFWINIKIILCCLEREQLLDTFIKMFCWFVFTFNWWLKSVNLSEKHYVSVLKYLLDCNVVNLHFWLCKCDS